MNMLFNLIPFPSFLNLRDAYVEVSFVTRSIQEDYIN